MDYIKVWKEASDAYNGEGGYYDGSNIDRYGRESDEKYLSRKKMANNNYENIFQSKVSRYVGYVFKIPPVRITDNEMLKQIMKDIDNSGSSANIFFKNFGKNMKVRGVNLLLVESPKQISSNMKDQLKNRELPYLVEINPERLASYQLTPFGAFKYVAFYDTVIKETTQDISQMPEKEVIIRYYDENEWRIYDDLNNIIDSGAHGLGICPVLIGAEKGKLESTGEFTQLTGMSKTLYNLNSELREMLRGQAFSILTMFKQSGAAAKIDLGVSNVLFYDGDKAPAFISADAAQAGTYETRIEKVEASMDRVAFDVSTTASKESGIALEIKFEGLNASLNSFAQTLEALECNAWEIITHKLSLPEDAITVSYSLDFSISDLDKEISNFSAINQEMDIPLYRAEKMKQLVSEDLEGIDNDILQEIFAQIDVYAKQEEATDDQTGNSETSETTI